MQQKSGSRNRLAWEKTMRRREQQQDFLSLTVRYAELKYMQNRAFSG